jgi:hypothetical protein
VEVRWGAQRREVVRMREGKLQQRQQARDNEVTNDASLASLTGNKEDAHLPIVTSGSEESCVCGACSSGSAAARKLSLSGSVGQGWD